MKKFYLILLLSFSGLCAQNFDAYTTGVVGEHSFSKAVDQFQNEIICSAGNPFLIETQSVYFLTHDGSQILPQTHFDSPDSNDAFGHDVSINGEYAAVSAPTYGGSWNYGGAVHLYRKVDGTWQYVTRIAPTDGGSNYRFGLRVKIHDGQLMVSCPYFIGANFTGKIYVYDLNDGTATLTQELTLPNNSLTGTAMDAEGNRFVCTSRQNGGGGSRVNIFEKVGGSWSSAGIVAAQNPANNIGLLRLNNNTIFMGFDTFTEPSKIEIQHHDGTQWIFDVTLDAFLDTHSLTAMDANGDTLIAGLSYSSDIENPAHSPCLLFKNNGGIWQLQQPIYGDGPTDVRDGFGCAVSVGPDFTLIGARAEGTDSQGALYYTNNTNLQTKASEFLTASVYPNPTHDKLFFDKISWANAKIYSATGKLMLFVDGPQTELSLGDLAQGLYLIKTETKDGQSQTFKIIKN